MNKKPRISPSCSAFQCRGYIMPMKHLILHSLVSTNMNAVFVHVLRDQSYTTRLFYQLQNSYSKTYSIASSSISDTLHQITSIINTGQHTDWEGLDQRHTVCVGHPVSGSYGETGVLLTELGGSVLPLSFTSPSSSSSLPLLPVWLRFG